MKTVKTILKLISFDPRKLIAAVRYSPQFMRDYFAHRKMSNRLNAPIILPPRLEDFGSKSVKLAKRYFTQDNLVADYIRSFDVTKITDVGSRLDGFVSQIGISRQ